MCFGDGSALRLWPCPAAILSESRSLSRSSLLWLRVTNFSFLESSWPRSSWWAGATCWSSLRSRCFVFGSRGSSLMRTSFSRSSLSRPLSFSLSPWKHITVTSSVTNTNSRHFHVYIKRNFVYIKQYFKLDFILKRGNRCPTLMEALSKFSRINNVWAVKIMRSVTMDKASGTGLAFYCIIRDHEWELFGEFYANKNKQARLLSPFEATLMGNCLGVWIRGPDKEAHIPAQHGWASILALLQTLPLFLLCLPVAVRSTLLPVCPHPLAIRPTPVPTTPPVIAASAATPHVVTPSAVVSDVVTPSAAVPGVAVPPWVITPSALSLYLHCHLRLGVLVVAVRPLFACTTPNMVMKSHDQTLIFNNGSAVIRHKTSS